VNKEGLKLAALACCVVLAMLYLVDWVSNAVKPAATKYVVSQLTNAAAILSTNAMSPTTRASLTVSLEHIRDEIGHTTNTTDLQVLRAAEFGLTNVLSHP